MIEWEYFEDEYGTYKKRINEAGLPEEITLTRTQKWHDENPPQEPEPAPPSETDVLAEELVKMKFENMQKDAVISTFGEEITKLKLEMMILKGGA